MSVCDCADPMALQAKVDILESIARNMPPEPKTGNRRWTRRNEKNGGK